MTLMNEERLYCLRYFEVTPREPSISVLLYCRPLSARHSTE